MARKVKYTTKDDLILGFSDDQIITLMKNMTIFAVADGCPSPCNMCAYKGKKTVDTMMDFSAIEWFYTNYITPFANNQNGFFVGDAEEGVAVFPTGFYRYDPAEPSYHATMQNRITPEDFRIQMKTDNISLMFLDNDGKEVVLKDSLKVSTC